jgi:hypothetical protein
VRKEKLFNLLDEIKFINLLLETYFAKKKKSQKILVGVYKEKHRNFN